MKYSLMTTSMIFELLMKLQSDEDKKSVYSDYKEMLAMVKSLGINAVEVTSMELEMFGVSAVKEALDSLEIATAGIIHLDTFASPNKDKSVKIIENAKEKVDIATILGTDGIMLALMAHSDVHNDSQEVLKNALITNIRPIAVYGQEKGIKVSVEDTPDIRLPLCDIKDTKLILEEIPELYLSYDTGNMILKGDDSISYYEKFADRVCHVHLKDMKIMKNQGDIDIKGQKIGACIHGEGIIDFNAVAKALKAHKYDGYIMIEYIGKTNHKENIQKCMDYLNQYFCV